MTGGLIGPNGQPIGRKLHVYGSGIGDSASVTVFHSDGTHRREDVVARIIVQVSETGQLQVVCQPVDGERLGEVAILEDSTHQQR